MLCIDPEAQTAEMLEPEREGESKCYAGDVLSANDKMYFVLSDAPQVLCIDPRTHALRPSSDDVSAIGTPFWSSS